MSDRPAPPKARFELPQQQRPLTEQSVARRSDDGDLPTRAADASGTVVSFFGSAVRKGSWEPPAQLRVFTMFGGAEIDYCEADMLEGDSTIEILVLFGGVTVRVPPDIDVDTSGIGIFGGFRHFDQKARGEPHPPRLRIRGLALFGGVEVKGPRKSRKDK